MSQNQTTKKQTSRVKTHFISQFRTRAWLATIRIPLPTKLSSFFLWSNTVWISDNKSRRSCDSEQRSEEWDGINYRGDRTDDGGNGGCLSSGNSSGYSIIYKYPKSISSHCFFQKMRDGEGGKRKHLVGNFPLAWSYQSRPENRRGRGSAASGCPFPTGFPSDVAFDLSVFRGERERERETSRDLLLLGFAR